MVKAMIHEHKHILPFFIPHLGCPHQCVFCNQHHVSGESGYPKAEDIEKAIHDWEEESLPEIAFYGGSFSGLPLDWQRYFLTPAFAALKKKKISGIRISTRPDYINASILLFLRSMGVGTIELGVQSLDDEVLERSGRGHRAQDVYQAISLLKEKGFQIGVQLMPGLPGDNREKCLRGAREISRLGPDLARIYPTLVLKETPLHKLFLEGKYHPLSLDEAVGISRDMLAVFCLSGVHVIRIGLQPTREIQTGVQVAAGPFHPAFGELVESALAREQIQMMVKGFLARETAAQIVLWVSPRDCSIIAGQHRRNMEFLKKFFHLDRIKIMGRSDLERGTVGISRMDGDGPDWTISQNQFLREFVALMAN